MQRFPVKLLTRQNEMAFNRLEAHLWKLSGPEFTMHGNLQALLLLCRGDL